MRSLVVAGYGVRLRASKGCIVVEEKGRKYTVPPSDVDQVVVVTGGVSLTSRLLRLLARCGVELVVLDSRGEPVAIMYLAHYTRTPTTRREQYAAYLDGRGVQVAREVAWCKMNNQAHHLEWRAVASHLPELREEARRIRRLMDQLARARLGSLDEARVRVMRLEAEAARIYWSSIAMLLPGELGFDGRDHDSPDPVNTSLNYCYAVLYSQCFRSLLLAGLDPYAGFLHVDRSGRPVLVYDYSEMFKPGLVDAAVVDLLLEGWKPRVSSGLLDREARGKLAMAVLSRLKVKVRTLRDPSSVSYGDALRVYAYRLAKSLRDHVDYQGFAER